MLCFIRDVVDGLRVGVFVFMVAVSVWGVQILKGDYRPWSLAVRLGV